MSRLRIVHTTVYNYDHRVTLSYNEARMTPLTDPAQVVLDSNVRVLPSQAAVHTYRDYWGTRVTAFDMQTAHSYLEVTATTMVEVYRSERAVSEPEGASWAVLQSPATTENFSDFLHQTPLSEPGTEVRALAAAAVVDHDPLQGATAIFDAMRQEMEYVPGSTGVHTNADEAWQQRRGVCQDLAHLAIGALRSVGIPARYVSGYIHPRPSAGIGEAVAGQSHAWIEFWNGEWRSWDPTNHKPAGDLHVSVARGRDYRDVTPLKGILSGGGGAKPHVTVQITRLA
ncbi:MAG: transglutaminase family protein [Acidobacteria bacterium]|nr:transglutaminase family protein [Acidobacteriota bacterium]